MNRARAGRLLFWSAFAIWAIVTLVKTGQKALARDQAAATDLRRDVVVTDFEGFYRSAARMAGGEVMYFPHTEARLEMPSKHGPFFELVFRPLLALDPGQAAIVFNVVSFAALALTIVLGQRAAESAAGRRLSPWVSRVGFLLLVPFAHLAALYTQTAFLLVLLFFAGLLLLFRGAPFAAGLTWSLPAAWKLLPLVLLPWLLWKRAWRAAAGMAAGLALSTAAVLLDQGIERGGDQFAAYARMLRADSSFETYHERFQGLPSLVLATITPRYEPGLRRKTRSETSSRPVEPPPERWDGVRNFLGSERLWEIGGLLAFAPCVLLALGCAFACRPRPEERARRWLGEAGIVLIAMLLITPHTWQHYFWWMYPAVLLAVAEFAEGGRRRRWSVGFLAVVLLALTVPHKGTPPKELWKAFHVFHGLAAGALVLYAVLWARLWSRRGEVEG